MAYTDQRPAEYTAVDPGRGDPLGLGRAPSSSQGDHFQFNAKQVEGRSGHRDRRAQATSPARRSAAGFLNIDIDSTTLVDLSQPTVAEQQRVNAQNSVELTR